VQPCSSICERKQLVVWFDRARSVSSTPKASLTEFPANELSGWACTMPFAG
jgi:hypothetical protein